MILRRRDLPLGGLCVLDVLNGRLRRRLCERAAEYPCERGCRAVLHELPSRRHGVKICVRTTVAAAVHPVMNLKSGKAFAVMDAGPLSSARRLLAALA